MATHKSRNRSKAMPASRAYATLAEWKEVYFPEMMRQEAYQSLRKDTEQLAVTLANDTFERVRGRGAN